MNLTGLKALKVASFQEVNEIFGKVWLKFVSPNNNNYRPAIKHSTSAHIELQIQKIHSANILLSNIEFQRLHRGI